MIIVVWTLIGLVVVSWFLIALFLFGGNEKSKKQEKPTDNYYFKSSLNIFK